MGALSGILGASESVASGITYADAAEGAWEVAGASATESPEINMAGSELENTLSLSDAAEEAEKSANGSTGILDRAKKAMQELSSSAVSSGTGGGSQLSRTGIQGGTVAAKAVDMSRPQETYGSVAPNARQVMAMNTDAGDNMRWMYSTMKK